MPNEIENEIMPTLVNYAMSAESELYNEYVMKGIELGERELGVTREESNNFYAFGSGRIGQQLFLERCLALSNPGHEAVTFVIGSFNE